MFFQSLSHVQLFATLWTAAFHTSMSFTISRSSLKLLSIESVMLSNYLILYFPFFLLPSIFLGIRVFSSELTLHIRWPKYCSFSIRPWNENSGLISFRIDWFDLFAVQGTLKRLLQHPNLKASILWSSALPCGPTLTSIHGYWQYHSFDYVDLCRQNGISTF